jgi:Right handed beta helix region
MRTLFFRQRARALPSFITLLLGLVFLGGISPLAAEIAQPIIVTTVADSGPGSLRQAILDANLNPGADTIVFDIPGSGVQTINLLSELPSLTDDAGVSIDGFTQPGASPNTLPKADHAVRLIEIKGDFLTVLTATSNHNTLRGLAITGNAVTGIRLSGASSSRIVGNLISAAFGQGVEISSGSTDNLVGGTVAEDRNVISGNGSFGVYITDAGTSRNVVQGNLIGTMPNGSAPLANIHGVVIGGGAGGNTLGGTAPGAGNVISGNTGTGIAIEGAGTVDNVVQGNLIGINAAGDAALPNNIGIQMGFDATGNTVGGSQPGARNVVSGNLNPGVILILTSGNEVAGNLIGTDVTGNLPLGNGAFGVFFLSNANNNTVVGNVIAFTREFEGVDGGGVLIASSSGNSILFNSIHDNAALGISLQNGNNQQQAPLLTHALVSGVNGKIVITGTQNSDPSSGGNHLQFFLADNDPSGHGEGKTLLLDTPGLAGGSVTFKTPPSAPLSPVSAGNTLTATATTNVGTSEFSQNLAFTVNQRPIANAGVNQTVTKGSRVTLDGTGSRDPDALPNGASIANGSFTWRQIAGPTVTLSNPTSAAPAFTANAVGTLVFSLVVSDGLDVSANPATVTVGVMPQRVTALGPARIWVGLRNSDDVGTRFDLKAEVLKNGLVVGSGEVDNVPGGSSGFNNALLNTIRLTFFADFSAGDTLSIRFSVRAGATGHRSGTARLWFGDSAASSRFDVKIDGVLTSFYLLDGSVLGSGFGPGPKKTIDVFVDRLVGGNPFKPFGTWSKTF